MKHFLLVVNPTAESHTDDSWITELLARLNSVCECIVSVCYTSKDTTTEKLIELLEPPIDLVIAAGGDGTLRFALEALAEKKSNIPLAIIPTGTGNVLARNLGIVSEKFFANPMEHAIDSLIEGVVHPLDLGRANGSFFSGIAGVGPMAEAFAEPAREDKTRMQMFAYAASMLETIAVPPDLYRIYTEDSTLEVKASGVFVSNVPDFGFHHSPELSYLSDGFLNLVIVSPEDFNDYLKLGYRFIAGEEDDDMPIYSRSVQELFIEVADRNVPRSSFQEMASAIFNGAEKNKGGNGTDSDQFKIMLDGELCGMTPVHVKVVPHAVNVIVPKEIARINGARSWLSDN